MRVHTHHTHMSTRTIRRYDARDLCECHGGELYLLQPTATHCNTLQHIAIVRFVHGCGGFYLLNTHTVCRCAYVKSICYTHTCIPADTHMCTRSRACTHAHTHTHTHTLMYTHAIYLCCMHYAHCARTCLHYTHCARTYIHYTHCARTRIHYTRCARTLNTLHTLCTHTCTLHTVSTHTHTLRTLCTHT